VTETAKPIAADRERLPNRRELLSLNDDGRLAEVFLTAAKSGTAIDAVAGHEALEGAVERASASARPRQSKRLISRSSSRNCLMPRRPASSHPSRYCPRHPRRKARRRGGSRGARWACHHSGPHDRLAIHRAGNCA